ncbi:MAG TPA: YceI family protein [Baekduia sp.]|nr:YceI family protein [Baekduia sp.]
MATTAHQVPAGTYAVDPVHSTIGFAVAYNGVAKFRSGFATFDAQLADGVLTGSAQADSIQVDEPNFKAHLLSEEFFGAEATPAITFRSTDIRVGDADGVEVDGELTIRGTTKPVTATGTFGAGADAWGNERVAFELQTTVDRREFGLDWQNQLPNGNDALAWDVTLHVDLQLVKA